MVSFTMFKTTWSVPNLVVSLYFIVEETGINKENNRPRQDNWQSLSIKIGVKHTLLRARFKVTTYHVVCDIKNTEAFVHIEYNGFKGNHLAVHRATVLS